MTRKCETPQLRAAGPENCSLRLGENNPPNNPPLAQAQTQKRPDPIILASECRMTADLLAECVEYALGYGSAILAAVRQGDDEAILANFRFFDLAARTARRSAEELRTMLQAAGAP